MYNIDPNFTDQQKVYEDLGIKILENSWAGYNTSLFAYGQTGSGKSYSVVGYGAEKGIVPRVSEEIFTRITNNTDASVSFRVELSMLEIYNEEVRDLLNPKSGTLELRENKQVGVYVDGLVCILQLLTRFTYKFYLFLVKSTSKIVQRDCRLHGQG